MLEIKISKQSERFLRKLITKHFLQIESKLVDLRQNSKPNDCVQLKGNKKFYRVDIGEYRIIYKITETDLMIDVIGKRNDSDVYKRFLRKNEL